MISISPAAYDAFTHLVVREFDRRAADLLRRCLPVATSQASPAELGVLIQEARLEANRFNVTSERGMVRWMVLRFAIGRDFHQLPQVKAALAAPAGPEVMLHAIFERLAILELRR